MTASTGMFAGMGSLGKRVDRTCHSAVSISSMQLVNGKGTTRCLALLMGRHWSEQAT